MADYPPEEKVGILLILGECRGNYRRAATLYRERYPERRHPSHSTIRDIHLRAQQGHLVRNRQKKNRNENDWRVMAVLGMVHLNPQISSRQIERQSGIPRRKVLRILHDLSFHPYHITLTQALMPNDLMKRMRFCHWAQTMILQNPNFFRYVMFSDEATFKNIGELNRHNSHYWSDVNPHWQRGIDHQHRWSINVWCGILNGYLIGPYFFEGNVNGNNFLAFLRNELPVLLEDVDLVTRARMWVQLDGAPPHNYNPVRAYLNERYRRRWIGPRGPVAWPARSPDLTPPDFYLWGYLKDAVFATEPTTRDNMMERIRGACQSIGREILLSTIDNFQRRIELCIQQNGNVFENLL